MRALLNWFRAPRHASRPVARRNRATRPGLELLEDRNLMSVQYGGGPLLEHPQIETVFFGHDWYTNRTLHNNAVQLDNYFNDITQSDYLNLLNEYGCGWGSFEDGVIDLNNPAHHDVVDDTEIQNMLDRGIRQGDLDLATANQVYFVFTEPSVLVTNQGSDSQHDFAGYHNTFYDPAIGPVYYAVIPNPIGNAHLPGLNSFEQQTAAASHELAEAATDPDLTTGWRDYLVTGGEIGDLAWGNYGVLDGYVVQALYSNYYDGPVLPDDATPFGGGDAAAPATRRGQTGTDGSALTPLSSPLQDRSSIPLTGISKPDPLQLTPVVMRDMKATCPDSAVRTGFDHFQVKAVSQLDHASLPDPRLEDPLLGGSMDNASRGSTA